MASAFEFTLNGRSIRVADVSPNTTLLDYLRNSGLTGAKEGCAEGDCGACSVAIIERGADVNAQDSIQDSAFLLAGARGYTEIVRATLAAGADLKSTNRYGGTALIPAAHHGHVEVVRELLQTRIAVDHVNRLGWTALLEAVILGDGGPAHSEIVRLLRAAGARYHPAHGVCPAP
mgnify:CR=1 FL=1